MNLVLRDPKAPGDVCSSWGWWGGGLNKLLGSSDTILLKGSGGGGPGDLEGEGCRRIATRAILCRIEDHQFP